LVFILYLAVVPQPDPYLYFMIKKKIVIAGGTGFIGQFLERKFVTEGYDVVIISRGGSNIHWGDEQGIIQALEGAELLINLAGKSVDCRYNEANKHEILRSRTGTTLQLGKALLECKQPPVLWLNSSTATIYRHADDRPMTEQGGEIGSGFSVSVAKAWEEALFSVDLPKTRKVALRIAIVLGKGGGVIVPYLNLVHYGLGGRQGNGNQMFSWIHLEDLYRIILFVQQHEEIDGAINCVAPYPVKNKEQMRTFRKLRQQRFGLPMPRWLLKMGAAMIGTETELVLKSRWVLPERLLKNGFEFKYPTLEEALKDILEV
jgi:uncharacterized protein (TIGR01777 family)